MGVIIFILAWLILSFSVLFVYALVFTYIRVRNANVLQYFSNLQKLNLHYFTQGKNFWIYAGYLEIAVSLFILYFFIGYVYRQHKNRRQNKIDSNEFGGVHGSARWATKKEISVYWGEKRVKIKARKIETE